MTGSARGRLDALLSERILVLDGAMGTALQAMGLGERDFRGDRFAVHPRDLLGDNDVLNLTRPDAVERVHRGHLAAGAHIVSTNTFTATAVAQADYGLADAVYDMNRAGAEIARRAADAAGADRFVAGSVGPTNQTLSMSPRVADAAYRAITFDELVGAYAEQIRGLRDGGADLLLIETIFDTLNAKAALVGIDDVSRRLGAKVPLMLSVTVIDRSGRTMSGQTLEAFWASVAHARPMSVGLNCGLGATEMRPFLEELASVASTVVSCYPNAGLPNALGQFDEAPERTGALLREMAGAGLCEIVGGCCGTTPDHIRHVAEEVAPLKPRAIPERPVALRLSGLEPFEMVA